MVILWDSMGIFHRHGWVSWGCHGILLCMGSRFSISWTRVFPLDEDGNMYMNESLGIMWVCFKYWVPLNIHWLMIIFPYQNLFFFGYTEFSERPMS